jgi:RNA polymerase sigma factor (TIGR02999 family)
MPQQSPHDIVDRLFSDLRSGNREAINQIVEELYPELRRVAAAQMRRERPGNTLQPTALVHELYLELAKAKPLDARDTDAPDQKRKFIGLAGFMMMRLLIHHARPLYRRVEKLPLDEADVAGQPSTDKLAQVENLLRRLAAIDPDFRAVVEMKVFEGCSIEEIANRLSCGPRTVERRWHFAKHWLRRELGDGATGE